jgi:acetoin utilization deacetylase AcuC-like enzyme
MLAVHHPDQALHDPQRVFFMGKLVPHWDQPERYHLFLRIVQAQGHELAVAPDAGIETIVAVHEPAYVAFLQTAWDRWKLLPNAGSQAIASAHPTHRMRRMPRDILGQLGWYSNGTSCAVLEHTWRAVYASASTAVHAAERLAQHGKAVYALCRPPGHHSYPDLMSGICYLNNAAIAAEMLVKRYGRVAVFDIDVHHGNGTQAIFWTRPDVLFCSIHVDPSLAPPYYAGCADEVGEGPGRGQNLNIPLPWGTRDHTYLVHVDKALDAISRFGPGALVVSLGLDASEHETLPTFKISNEGFAETASRISGLDLPTLLVQEGGYLHPRLGDTLSGFLAAFEAAGN